ncbi:MAG: helix-hairpin-helix domain-containing protein [Candidatus Eisenbacteria sp.]|nr:helix-hairpin-helix domain-containing protein [Candidatus Eisenbacteria bacterium]
MRGIFTREERVVVLFLAVSLLVGTAVVQAGRVFPSLIPDFGGASGLSGQAPEIDELPTWPVDINTADVTDLVRLPGVGPVRASAIVYRREVRGRYSTLEELLEIKGIGPVTLDGLRDKATVGGGAVSAADSGRTTDASGPVRRDARDRRNSS